MGFGTTPVVIRRASVSDAEICGRIAFDAFATLDRQHDFPPHFPDATVPIQVLGRMFSHPGFCCFVAELDGKIVGSNCLDERSVIAGVGPITIDPAVQNSGIGRGLMEAALERAQHKQFAGVRLVQAAYNTRSLSLYASLGFVVREPLAIMQGTPIRMEVSDQDVRVAQKADLPECNDVCSQVHGHDRAGELADAIESGTARITVSGNLVTGYVTVLGTRGHAVAKTETALQAMIASGEEFEGAGILVPVRDATLFCWCLNNGLRVVKPMLLMSRGFYTEPAGAYLPSILF